MSRIIYEIVYGADNSVRNKTAKAAGKLRKMAFNKESGIDGILVTVGLCIIALLLCVVMKDSMTDFIKTIVTSMTNKATTILSGT
jgi:hypothetical protein